MSDGKSKIVHSLFFRLFLLSLALSFAWLRWQDDCVIGVFILLILLFCSRRFMASLFRLFHPQKQNLQSLERARTWLLLALVFFLLGRLLMERPFWWQGILSFIPVLFFIIMILFAVIRGWKEALLSWGKDAVSNEFLPLSPIVLSSSLFLFLISPLLLFSISPSTLFLEQLPYSLFAVPLVAAVLFLSKRWLLDQAFHSTGLTETKCHKNPFSGGLMLGLYVALFLVAAGTFRTWLQFRDFHQAQQLIFAGRVPEAVGKLVRVRDSSKVGFLRKRACGMLGEIFLRDSDDIRARENFLLLLKLNPRSAPAHLGLGRLDEKRGELEWAARHYAKALELRPRFQPALRALAAIYVHLGDYASLTNLVISNPELEIAEPEARFRLAQILLSESKPAQAIPMLESLPDDFSRKGYYLGRSYLELDELEDALMVLKTACEKEPKFADAWFRLGLAQEGLGEIEPAKQSFSRAIGLLPNHLGALIHLHRLQETENKEKSQSP